MKPPLRKRTYLLWDSFQFRFLAISLVHFFIIIMTFVVTLFVPLMVQLDNLSLSLAEKQDLASQFLSLHQRVWPAVLVVVLLLAVHSIFFSHRIAGPLYRARRIFKAIAGGDLTVSTVIRKGDYLHTEMECLDEMVTSIKTKIADIEAQQRELHGPLAELRRAVESGAMTDAGMSMKKVDEQLERLRVCVDHFRKTG